MSAKIEPYKIAVPESELQKLRTKLSLASYPDEVSFSDDWNYGSPLKDVKRLAAYWETGYDWRKHEEQLNTLPQFVTTIAVEGFEDLEIHFVHQKSETADAIPLLFCHGCERPAHCSDTDLQLILLRHAQGLVVSTRW